MTHQPRNTIRTFALICVAITSLFIMAMSYWLTTILAAPDWCGRAINAEKLSTARETSTVELCKDLLLEQVNALANNSHIYSFSIALCLVALMLIVVAGGRLSFSASKAGVSGNIARDDPGDVDPTPVTVVNPPSQPVPTTEAKPPLPTAEEKGE